MMMAPAAALTPAARAHQRGMATLYVVIIFVLMSMLLSLWASRTSWFNELVVGNDADYQRAFEAAQALLQDAELDIRGERADGSACAPASLSAPYDVCRVASPAKFPQEGKELGPLILALNAETTGCRDGMCVKRLGRQDFWNNGASAVGGEPEREVPLQLLSVLGVGARYGQYTGAKAGSSSAPANPLLRWDDDSAWNQGGWYWIEVLPYSQLEGGLAGASAPNVVALPSPIYRITAVVHGRRPGTQVVLQETYARAKQLD